MDRLANPENTLAVLCVKQLIGSKHPMNGFCNLEALFTEFNPRITPAHLQSVQRISESHGIQGKAPAPYRPLAFCLPAANGGILFADASRFGAKECFGWRDTRQINRDKTHIK